MQWNLNQNTTILIYGNDFANVVCKMSTILSQPWCVNMCVYWLLGVLQLFALIISMGQWKKDVYPLLTHWSYVFLALAHRCIEAALVPGAPWNWMNYISEYHRRIINV